MHRPEDIVNLLRKYLSGTLSNQETIALQEWAKARPENQRLMDYINQDDRMLSDIRLYWELWNEAEATDRKRRIFDHVRLKITTPRRAGFHRLRKWIPYAAVLLLTIIASFFLFRHQQTPVHEPAITAEDIMPGGNRATLTLSDGRTIDLNADQSGIVVGNGITYLDGSTITDHTSSGSHQTEDFENLVLKTPLGGNYQIVLPDGSEVWLNASSTLVYPAQFSTEKRIVQLEGEAYFDVKPWRVKGKDVPFEVRSNGQAVHVLGTAFNVSAYGEEPQTITTLVSGHVEVINLASNNSHRIIPGQQAVLQDSQMKVDEADISKAIAWKDNRFSFDGKTFKQIMREMARWYNLTVEYEGEVPTDQFTGDAYKTEKLATVLRFLESSDIQYRVEPERNGKNKLIIHHKDRKEATTN